MGQLVAATNQARRKETAQMLHLNKLYMAAVERIGELEAALKTERAKGHVQITIDLSSSEGGESSVEEAIVIEEAPPKPPPLRDPPLLLPALRRRV
jgi:hypothetical protein